MPQLLIQLPKMDSHKIENNLIFDPVKGEFRKLNIEEIKKRNSNPSLPYFWNTLFIENNIPLMLDELEWSWSNIVINNKNGFVEGWNSYFKILNIPMKFSKNLQILIDKEFEKYE